MRPGSWIRGAARRAKLKRRRRKFFTPVGGIGDPAGYRFELRSAYVSIFLMSVEPLCAEVAGLLIAGVAILPKDATPSTIGAPTIEKETRAEEALDLPWQVVVHHDPVNLMSYVTTVFQPALGYPREKA